VELQAKKEPGANAGLEKVGDGGVSSRKTLTGSALLVKRALTAVNGSKH
jgi:hypothetical protein